MCVRKRWNAVQVSFYFNVYENLLFKKYFTLIWTILKDISAKLGLLVLIERRCAEASGCPLMIGF